MKPEGFASLNDRISAALGFCRGRKIFRHAAAWKAFVHENMRAVMEAAIARNLPDAARYFMENEAIPMEVFTALLEKAQQAKAAEIVAMLLDYRGKKLADADVFARFDLDLE